MSATRTFARRLVPALVLVASVGAVVAAPTATTIPLSPNGDAIDGSRGAPVILTSSSLVVATTGVDGSIGTADDATLLLTGIGGAPVPLPLPTPFHSGFSGRIVRMSATRVLVTGAGPDGAWRTSDDEIFLLDRLGSSNVVTPMTVGGLQDRDGAVPERLGADTAVVATAGADLAWGTADDAVVLLSSLGTANQKTALPAPRLGKQGRFRPVALSPTSFLVHTLGDDASDSSADDAVYLFEDVGGANTRTTLSTPFVMNGAPGRPVRVKETRALIATLGPDGILNNADDEVLVLDKLGQGNQVRSVATPNLDDYGANVPVPLDDRTTLVVSQGPDADKQTADDQILVITGIGGGNPKVDSVTVGGLDEDAQCGPVRLSATSAAFCSAGFDNLFETTDDEVVVLSDIGGTNAVTRIPVPGLADGTTSRLETISPTSVLLSTGGPDGVFGSGGDDAVVLITGIGGTPVVETVSSGGDIPATFGLGFVPQVLGAGRAVLLDTATDDNFGGGDDGLRIVGDLPDAQGMVLLKAKLKFLATNPDKGEKATVKALLFPPDGTSFGSSDLTVTIGNATQVLPQKSVVEKKPGVFLYSDRTGAEGFIRKLSFKASKGKLAVKAKGLGTGIETTGAGHVVFAVEGQSFALGDSPAGVATSKGITYKRPKE